MKRPKTRSDTIKDAACLVCHEHVDIFYPVRSNTWFAGITGVRVMLCSTACQEKYDAENLSHASDTMEAHA